MILTLPDAGETERQWLSKAGYQCLAYRHPSLGHWCGYVGLPDGNPMHGKHYDAIDADVHGGLTYAYDHAPNGKPDGRWWIGFDCAHAGDVVPGVSGIWHRYRDDGAYRDIDFVVAECERLARQMADA